MTASEKYAPFLALGVLVFASVLWAVYMHVNVLIICGLLMGSGVTAWQIHRLDMKIPVVASSSALIAGVASIVGFAFRAYFSNLVGDAVGIGTAAVLVIFIVFVSLKEPAYSAARAPR
ncbi:Uncharacterised protein [Corynebacterium renale]|uniref:hypothetical protein n=1 Tax=Corynebacterium renale TaxID=1724 RepID=UPI000DA279C7|nr:hypothetical protein [Corynebacterium renale]SQG64213.1 Uncharacterised protein [Corynebacterium renale]STC94626.1 Uncharacterised protein [Corynebacterium renale]